MKDQDLTNIVYELIRESAPERRDELESLWTNPYTRSVSLS